MRSSLLASRYGYGVFPYTPLSALGIYRAQGSKEPFILKYAKSRVIYYDAGLSGKPLIIAFANTRNLYPVCSAQSWIVVIGPGTGLF